jgi:Ti-type conjugative transfer relaxase TraA
MAIYHFSAKLISRASGSSALAAAAYRSAGRLYDQRLDRHHDFSNKAGVVHSEVMLPEHAPAEWADREKLWNAVEAAEVRKDAQLAREVEFALPRELTQADGIELAREFVAQQFVSRGMVADLNVHWDLGADGEPKPHAHVMLTTRSADENGFGPKERDWNRTDLLEQWRERWGEHVNARLAELDIDARIDHRSLEAQGIALEPQHKIGAAASRRLAQGLSAERLDEHHAIARANGERIIAKPSIALDAITHQQSTFTRRDLARFVHRHSEDKDQFDRVMTAVETAPEIVRLGRDGKGEERFTSRDMLETEQRLETATDRLASTLHVRDVSPYRDHAIAAAATRGLHLSEEQRTAFEHITTPSRLGVVLGYAGTGKSAMLGVARDAWERGGFEVQGLALSGIAAENLEQGSGISSRTIASLEHHWSQGRELLTADHILVIDEAGMIGSRQMERVISEAQKRGAKVVLVGDPEQLQAIEAGAAFRSMAERHGAIEITGIRRQQEEWQRTATRQLATGRTAEALEAYDRAGHIYSGPTREAARATLINHWDEDRRSSPSVLILTHSNEDVRLLNQAARERVRASSGLGKDVTLQTERGERSFARGDRVMFFRNERSLGVKNGTLGTIERISRSRMAVMLDDRKSVAFDLKDYAQIDHGYAATIHKAQGMTVDRVHVLATPGMDRHGAYVALSRHRTSVTLHYGQDDFASHDRLVATLSRERAKDMASDYARDPSPSLRRAFAQRRQIIVPEPVITPPTRGLFDGLRLSTPSAKTQQSLASTAALRTLGLESPEDREARLGVAVQRFARATRDRSQMAKLGLDPLPHQHAAFDRAAAALDNMQPEASRDLTRVFARDKSLVDEAAEGRTRRALQAMQLEAELRLNPERRADQFVRSWQRLEGDLDRFRLDGENAAVERVSRRMLALAHSLERDPALESLLRERRLELGLPAFEERHLSQALPSWLGLSRGRGLSR